MENEEEVELEVNDLDNTSEVEVEQEVQQENTKTYSQEDVDAMIKEIHEKNQKAWNKRWGQEKSKMEESFAKYKEVTDVVMKGTGAMTIDDLLNNAYQQYGVEKPKTQRNSKDDEILGKYDAQDILELEYEHIVAEANRLASMERTPREEAKFLELGKYLTDKEKEEKLNKEIKENGFDTEVINSNEFKEFRNKFNENTSLKDIMEIYSKTQSKPKVKPFSAGSAKGKAVKEESEYFTVEEFNALTDKDLQDDKIYEKAMKTARYLNK